MKDLKKRYGSWALVTGASSGIGEEFARQLAARRFNLVLADNQKPLLANLANEFICERGIDVRTIQVDLSRPGSVDVIEKATRDIEIGLLVANAGAETHGDFLNQDIVQEVKLAYLNAIAPMELAHLFGRKMTERGQGGIIFVSSTMGYQAVPYLATYSANKAYLLTLGEALHYELKRTGVDVTVLSPGPTDVQNQESCGNTWRSGCVGRSRWASKESSMPASMNDLDWSRTPIKRMSTESVVKTAFSALGKKPSVIPGRKNNLYAFVSRKVRSRKGSTSVFGGMMEKAIAREPVELATQEQELVTEINKAA